MKPFSCSSIQDKPLQHRAAAEGADPLCQQTASALSTSSVNRPLPWLQALPAPGVLPFHRGVPQGGGSRPFVSVLGCVTPCPTATCLTVPKEVGFPFW